MTNTLDDIKYIMPPLDLTKTKKGNNNKNNSINNNNSKNTKANTEDITLNKKRSNFESEEWLGIMKNVGLTEEEMERFFKNKFIAKLVDAIDNLLIIIFEKSKLLGQTLIDKASLNKEISSLKKDNISLTQNYLEIREKLKNLENKKKVRQNATDDNDDLNGSMVNYNLHNLSYFC